MDDTPLKFDNLSQESSNEIELKLKKQKRAKIIYIIVGIALVIIIIGIVIAVLTSPKKDEEQKPKPRSLLEKLKKYKTPYYYYNTTLLNQTIDEALRLAKQHNIEIHFSLKSNFN